MLTLFPLAAGATEFPPITEQEKALTAVPGDPQAPAVVLFRRGELHFQDRSDYLFESKLTIRKRIKILTEEGKSFGELYLPSYQSRRLESLEGRTVLPDGKVLPLVTQGIQQLSRRGGLELQVAAFDNVEVGAILDLEMVIRQASLFNFEFWYFHDRVPTVLSEITYRVPKQMGVVPLLRESSKGLVQMESDLSGKNFKVLRAWAERLPAIPDEPYGFPLADLSAQFLLLPTEYNFEGLLLVLFKDWPSTCELYSTVYRARLRDDGKAKKKARALAADKPPREQVAEIYRFVRDEVETTFLLSHSGTADDTLAEGEGDSLSKALLLQAMLSGIKLDADLVWTGFRSLGRIFTNAPNPGAFQHEVVRVAVEGEEIFLDPSAADVAFGRLPPEIEGMPGMVFDLKNPVPTQLPSSPYDSNQRQIQVEVEIDDAGAAHGSGSLVFTGHNGWEKIGWKETDDETAEAWKEWLEEALSAFTVQDVKVVETVAESRVEVRWQMDQREDTVLGDEWSFRLSRPLGPETQPFARNRRTPVLLPHGRIDGVRWTVRWPAGWEVEVLPLPAQQEAPFGTFRAGAQTLEAQASEAQTAEDGGSLTYQRSLQLRQREIQGSENFQSLFALYDIVEKSDAQELVLIRR